MQLVQSDHIREPLFNCCQQSSDRSQFKANSPFSPKFTYQTKTTDPTSSVIKPNLSSNFLASTKHISNSQHTAPKTTDKLSIRNKKNKQIVPKKQAKSANTHLDKEHRNNIKQTRAKKDLTGFKACFQNAKANRMHDSQHTKTSPLKPKTNFIAARRPSELEAFQRGHISWQKVINESPTNRLQSPKNLNLTSPTNSKITANAIFDSKNANRTPRKYSSKLQNAYNSELMTSPQREIKKNAQFFRGQDEKDKNQYSKIQNQFRQPFQNVKEKPYLFNIQKISAGNPDFHKNTNYLQLPAQIKPRKSERASANNSFVVPHPLLIESKFERRVVEQLNPQSFSVLHQQKKQRKFMPPRESDLNHYKESCVSEIDDSPEEAHDKLNNFPHDTYHTDNARSKRHDFDSDRLNPHNQANTSLISGQRSHISKFGRLNFNNHGTGFSIMTVNSIAESVHQSKINHKIEESMVMQDFFNPAKTLLNKWGKNEDEN